MSRKPFLTGRQGRNGEPELSRGNPLTRLNQGRAGHVLQSNFHPVVIQEDGEPVIKFVQVSANETLWADAANHSANYGAARFEWDLTLFIGTCNPTTADIQKQINDLFLGSGTDGETVTSTQTDVIDLLDADGNVLKTISISGNYSHYYGTPGASYADETAESTMGVITPDSNGVITAFNAVRYTPGFDHASFHNPDITLYFLTDPYDVITLGEVPP